MNWRDNCLPGTQSVSNSLANFMLGSNARLRVEAETLSWILASTTRD
jgi:hypothetical protein